MKKIFWAIQNLECIGGTETVSIDLMNLLVDTYEIHLVCSTRVEEKVNYHLDPRIIVHNLGVSPEISRFDQSWAEYGRSKQYGKRIKLLWMTFVEYVLHRNKRRKQIASWMGKDDIYVGSALDSYLNAPKGIKVFYHFHFSANNFFSFWNRLMFHFVAKPESFIFLTNETLKEVTAKKKKIKAVAIHNPIKFDPVLSMSLHHHSLLFVGRFAEQKDPFLALNVAKCLHDERYSFTLTMMGEGHFLTQMNEFVKKNELSEVKIVTGHTTTREDYLAHDLLLCTSVHEGFCLVKNEANAASLPVVTSHWDGPIEEVFDRENDGFIIESRNPADYANKIKEMLSDEAKFKEMKKRAYESSLKTSPLKIKEQWISLFGK